MHARPLGARRRARTQAVTLLTVLGLAAGCGATPTLAPRDGRLQVVTTTGLLRDMVANVGGDRVDVVSLVPDGADPHTYEPSLRDTRNVVYADVAFSNYALLEEHSIIRTLDANLRPAAANISLAEESVKYAAELIPLVEAIHLDTVWLGLRAHGRGQEHGATRASQVLLSATAATGPGDIYAYLTGTFGDTDVYIDSSDGFDPSDGYRRDTATLPADAHTHLSWAFTQPGLYTLRLQAALQATPTSQPVDMGSATFTFAVGVNAAQEAAASGTNTTVLNRGHADLTINLEERALEVRYDPEGGGAHTQQVLQPGQVLIDVPTKALTEVPPGSQFSFLGRAGTAVYQLPQAVLGKHVHGEIDPHLWQDVRNAMAYVGLIRDTLAAQDPDGAASYRERAAAYLADLEETDDYVRSTIAQIPQAHRHLITTHDAFAYLGHAYGVEIAGFVTPNPAGEPSLADRRKLTQTIRNLHVGAVFLEPNLASRSSTLTEVAGELGVHVCPIYGDAFDETVTSYIQMMRFNADSLRACLTPPSG